MLLTIASCSAWPAYTQGQYTTACMHWREKAVPVQKQQQCSMQYLMGHFCMIATCHKQVESHHQVAGKRQPQAMIADCACSRNAHNTRNVPCLVLPKYYNVIVMHICIMFQPLPPYGPMPGEIATRGGPVLFVIYASEKADKP